MIDTETSSPRGAFLALLAVLSALLFITMAESAFLRGLPGIGLGAASAFGIGFLSTAARSRRPSAFWAADLAGSVIGIAVALFILRAAALQPRHYWNQWVPFALAVGAVSGGIVVSQEIVATAIDRIQPRRRR